ncbi:MAG: DUF1294 domain-containing protein [Turicibacter sp.]|nr:DUF1294 domain-containing protein [Turicibacter sp.]
MEVFLLVIVNVISFTLMGIDKRRAIHRQRRISEKTLFTCAICFGSFGVFLGMEQFRHKTKHLTFKLGIPCLMIIQFLLILNL